MRAVRPGEKRTRRKREPTGEGGGAQPEIPKSPALASEAVNRPDDRSGTPGLQVCGSDGRGSDARGSDGRGSDEGEPPSKRASAPRTVPTNAEIAAIARNAALMVAGVTAVGEGVPGAVTTYGLPGRSVRGVLVSRTVEGVLVELHLTTRPVPLPALAEAVRSAVARSLRGLVDCSRIDVCIDSLDDRR